MDSSPENRKLNKDSLISDISYQKKRRLCRLLDVRDDWKKIAGHIKSYVGERPRYDELTIQMIEREGLIPRGSPTECLLRDWRSIRPKISELLDVLILAKLKNVADYVSEAILLEGKVIMPIRPPSKYTNHHYMLFYFCNVNTLTTTNISGHGNHMHIVGYERC